MSRRPVLSCAGDEYLALLRASLWGGVVADAPSDVAAVLQLADSQKTVPLIGDALFRGGFYPDGKMARTISSIIATTVVNQDLQCREISAVASLLAANGISVVLLKGQGLARYYPKATLRECGDIDLWVPEGDYPRSCELLLEYEKGLGEVAYHQSDKHFHLRRGYVIVELHRRAEVLTSPRLDALYRLMELDGLTRNTVPRDFCGEAVSTPADTFNALYVFLHAWDHFTGYGIGLRQICDWTMFLHARAGTLDLAALRESLTALGLMRPWQVFGALAVDVLGLPASEMPFYQARFARRGRNLFDLIIEEGNFGKERSVRKHRNSGTVAKKSRTVGALFMRAFRMLPVFPLLGFSLFFRGIGSGIRKICVAISA